MLTARAYVFALPLLLACGVGSALGAAGPEEAAEEGLSYLSSHPGDFSLVAYDVRPDGSPDPSGPALSIRPGERLPLASTMKIVILAAYAREVAAGRLDPHETLTVGDWETFYLALTDGGAHDGALEFLGQRHDFFGYAADPAFQVTLDDLARVMIRFSDNAATDFLRHRLGDGALRATMAELDLHDQDLPLSILGIFLSWSNHQTGPLSNARIAHLRRLTREGYAAEVRFWEAKFLDLSWRRAEHRFFRRGFSRPGLLARVAERTFPRGSAREYARIMAGVVSGTVLTPAAIDVMRRHLELHVAADVDFVALGRKAGSVPGVFTHASYGIPLAGELAGRARVAVLFVHRMSDRGDAAAADSLFPIYFDYRLLRDAGFARRAAESLVP